MFNEGGGVRNSVFPPKNHFPQIFAIFTYVTMSSSGRVSGQTRMDFKNPREVFAQHGLRNKTLLSVLAMELRAERVKEIFEAYFSIFSIFSFSPDFAGAVTASWG